MIRSIIDIRIVFNGLRPLPLYTLPHSTRCGSVTPYCGRNMGHYCFDAWRHKSITWTRDQCVIREWSPCWNSWMIPMLIDLLPRNNMLQALVSQNHRAYMYNSMPIIKIALLWEPLSQSFKQKGFHLWLHQSFFKMTTSGKAIHGQFVSLKTFPFHRVLACKLDFIQTGMDIYPFVNINRLQKSHCTPVWFDRICQLN